jgi:hypothetical protein
MLPAGSGHNRTKTCQHREATVSFNFLAESRIIPIATQFLRRSAVRFLGYHDRLECPTALSESDGWTGLRDELTFASFRHGEVHRGG